MSIRRKTIVVVFVSLLTSLIVGFFSMYFIISNRFEGIEIFSVKSKVDEQLMIIRKGFDSVNLINKDWGKWDDTYNFIKNGNQNYIDSNLNLDEYSILKLNAIELLDRKDNIVFYGSRDYQNSSQYKNDIELKSLLNKLIPKLNFRQVEDTLSGYMGETNIYYFSAHQVTKSVITDNSDIAGLIIFVREIDYKDPLNFGLTIPQNTSIDILDIKTEKDTTDVNKDNVSDIDASKIIVSSTINDYFGEPILILRMQANRIFTTESLTIIATLFIVLFLVLSLFGVVFFLSIDRNVFSKLYKFTSFLNRIKDPMTSEERLTENLGLEFKQLQDTINNLLDNVKLQKKELDKANFDFQEQNRQLVERQKDLDLRNNELNTLNQSMVGREIRMIELKTKIDELNKSVEQIKNQSNPS